MQQEAVQIPTSPKAMVQIVYSTAIRWVHKILGRDMPLHLHALWEALLCFVARLYYHISPFSALSNDTWVLWCFDMGVLGQGRGNSVAVNARHERSHKRRPTCMSGLKRIRMGRGGW